MDMEFAKASAVMLSINLLYAFLGLILVVAAIKVVDTLFLRGINLEEEIKRGNMAAAVFASALVLAATLIIGMSLGK